MVLFTFQGIIYVISGNLEARLNNIINILLVSQIYKTDFRIIWRKTKSFKLDLVDIYHDERFKGKLIEDKDVQECMKTDSYYYNPKMSIGYILTNTISVERKTQITKYENVEIKDFKWLVVDNLNGKRISMIPTVLVKQKEHAKSIVNLYNSLKINSMIDGYVNMFMKYNNDKKDLYCVYIHLEDHKEEYNELIKEIMKVYGNDKKPIRIFLVYNFENIDVQKAKSWTDEMNQGFGEDNIVTLKINDQNETLANIINFLCMRKMKEIYCISRLNEYLHELHQSANIKITIKKSKQSM